MSEVDRPATNEDYERRFKSYIVSTLCPWTKEDAERAAQDAWDAVSFEEHIAGGYEADPEGAAAEEMSYWSD